MITSILFDFENFAKDEVRDNWSTEKGGVHCQSQMNFLEEKQNTVALQFFRCVKISVKRGAVGSVQVLVSLDAALIT